LNDPDGIVIRKEFENQQQILNQFRVNQRENSIGTAGDRMPAKNSIQNGLV
jgi:hypothetical protein